MSFQDIESGRPLPARRDLANSRQDPTQAVASGVFQINTAVSTFQRLVNTLGTPKTVTGTSHSTLQFHNGSVSQAYLLSYMCVLQFLHDQKLCELEKKFEECSANEERQLLQKVAEMLASSSAKKKKLTPLQLDVPLQLIGKDLHSKAKDMRWDDEGVLVQSMEIF